VANVWVNGRRVVSERRLATVDESEVVTRSRTLARDLFRRAGLEDVLKRDRQERPEVVAR
jgi:hypothetical protein